MRLIDADELKDYLNSVAGCFDSTREVEENTISEIDSMEFLNIIKCKDCRYFKAFQEPIILKPWQGLCMYYNSHSVMKNDFCSRGKKNDD